MMLFTRKENWSLSGSVPRESQKPVPGPGRGWYRIYSYEVTKAQELPPVRYGEETIALVIIDIGAYRESDMDAEGLAAIRRILAAFADLGMDMILRLVYDTQGKGMEREPAFFAQVLAHIGQIGEVLREYAGHILLFQGLLVGSWGEMHSSKFLTDRHLRQMMERFFEATKGEIRLAFRTPALLRKAVKEGERVPENIGFFDDALLSDETHMGTFGMAKRAESQWQQAWCAGDEAAFLEGFSKRVPFGGEAVSGKEVLSAEEVIGQLAGLHVSYLNCVHDAACLARWREQQVLPGVSLYDYVGMHLGYRFAAEEVRLGRKGKEHQLTISIANRGFACYPADLRLELYVGERAAASAELRPDELAGGGRKTLLLAVSEADLAEGSPLSLRLAAKRGGRTLPFANEGAEERLSLGTPIRSFDGH